jgi:hypothetical protein
MNKILGLISLAGLSVNSAFAAVPANVTTAITDAGADAATVAGAVLVVVVGLMGLHYMKREAK